MTTYRLVDADRMTEADLINIDESADRVIVGWPELMRGDNDPGGFRYQPAVMFEVDRGHALGWVYTANPADPDGGDAPAAVVDFTCGRLYRIEDWHPQHLEAK